MKRCAELVFLIALSTISYSWGMDSLMNNIETHDNFEYYLSNIHNQIRWSLYNNEPYKTLEGFYRWDESMGIFKGLPSFSVHVKKYNTFLYERQVEIEACMAHHQLLKNYFLQLTEDKRCSMRHEAFIWVNNHFPHEFFQDELKTHKKEYSALKKFFKKITLSKKDKKS